MEKKENGGLTGRTESKICAVCGDIALGYNFNAITCESCKAFFRRNASKDKSLQCPFTESCQVTAVTRRFCQKCRLEKCFRVGMKRELIMTDEDKERKRRKIEANRARTGSTTGVVSSGIVSTTQPHVSSTSPFNLDISLMKFPFCDGRVETGVQTDDFPIAKSIQVTQTVDTAVQTDWCSLPVSQSNFGYLDHLPTERNYLEPVHRMMLSDLILASRALEAPVDQEITSLPGDEFKCCNGSESLLDVINLTAVAIRRLIKMCKRLTEFRCLVQQDQLSLLKHGCTQMMLLRSVVTFDPDRNSWKIPHTVDQMSRIRVEVLKEARGNLYEAHEAFLRTFDPRASTDINIINMLTAITLFDPDRPNLIHKDVIRQHQESYYELLQRYLETQYSEADAKVIFRHLIHKIGDLHRLNEDHVRVYLDVNPSQVEPLLIEIFDLKPH